MNGRNGAGDDYTGQAAQEVQRSLQELGRLARKRADDAKIEAVKGLNSAAETLRREAREAGAAPEATEQVDRIAQGLERTATYLRRHSYEDMGEDVSHVVKRNPLRTLAIVFVVGLVVGLVMRGDTKRAE